MNEFDDKTEPGWPSNRPPHSDTADTVRPTDDGTIGRLCSIHEVAGYTAARRDIADEMQTLRLVAREARWGELRAKNAADLYGVLAAIQAVGHLFWIWRALQ